MKNKGFYDYLDGKTPPETEEDRLLASLLEEVTELPEPDPGQQYWNNFNSRLQQKLEQTPAKQGFLARFAIPSGIFATLAAAAVVALMFIPGSPELETPVMADLDETELSLLASAFEDPYEDFAYDSSEALAADMDLADGELDLLMNIYDGGADNLENFNAEEFLALWETEG